MGLLELIIMAMLDVAEYMIISNKLIYDDKVCTHKVNKVLFIVYFIGFSIVIGFSSYLLDGKYNIIASFPLLTAMIFLIHKRKIKDTIYIYVITSIIIIMIQFVALVLLRMARIEIEFNFISGLFAHTVTLFLVFIIVLFVPINAIFKYVSKNNKIFKLLTLNMFIILVSLLFYWYIDIDSILKNMVIVAIILMLTILVNFVILKNGLKNDIDEQKLKAYEEHLPTKDKLIKDLRKKQHECDNHIQKLRMLIITGEKNENISDSESIKKEDSIKESKKTRK